MAKSKLQRKSEADEKNNGSTINFWDLMGVTTVFWARVLCSLAAEDACFRMRVTLGIVLIRSLVSYVCVPGTVSESVRICWFKRNSSNLDRAPKRRDSVLLNSWDSFLPTLLSVSSESCVIYSSLILGTDVFRDWPFLGFSSCISLVTAFVSQCCHFLGGKMLRSYEDWISFVFVNQLEIITKNVIL